MSCADCGRPKIRCRGVCGACYEARRGAGTLDQLPPSQRGLNNDYVVAEWEWLSSFGITKDQAAAQLGMTRAALEKALDRHQKKETAA